MATVYGRSDACWLIGTFITRNGQYSGARVWSVETSSYAPLRRNLPLPLHASEGYAKLLDNRVVRWRAVNVAINGQHQVSAGRVGIRDFLKALAQYSWSKLTSTYTSGGQRGKRIARSAYDDPFAGQYSQVRIQVDRR